MRNGMGQKGAAVVADPGAVGVLIGKESTPKRRRKVPKNIKGLKYKKRK
jgi:hypothetical protein